MARKLLVTPKGVAVYPRLAGKPDTKFDDAGVWKTSFVALDDAEGAALKATIDEAIKKSILAAKEEQAKETDAKKRKKVAVDTTPYSVDADTDKITFNFKMKASGVSKKTKEPWTMQPALFDAAGKPLTGNQRIGGGSIIRVSYELNPYTRPSTEQKATVLAGAQLRLAAVQIIELVEFGGNASYFGFEVEDSSTTTTEEPATETSEATTENAEPAKNDEF